MYFDLSETVGYLKFIQSAMNGHMMKTSSFIGRTSIAGQVKDYSFVTLGHTDTKITMHVGIALKAVV